MHARVILEKVRDRAPLDVEELRWLARSIADGGLTDAQVGAFAMAVRLNGLSTEARVGLTLAMRDTGNVMRWDLPGPVVDKHSTGGIGDCASLIIAPALAACGVFVPMISGRGLGHTGGTLDKLEAIPGLSTRVDEVRMRSIVAEAGAAIVAAGGGIAPADARLYAVRDVTGTVESIDLIVSSILSKKLAGGIDALILDIKWGSGAFMEDYDAAAELGRALVETANGAGCATRGLITDMNQPLAPSAGNSLEMISVMETLTGRRTDGRLLEVSAALAGELLEMAGQAENPLAGADRIREAIAGGRAAERFGAMVRMMGGPTDFVERWMDRLPAAPVILDVFAAESGSVAAFDGRDLGNAVVGLGGGRLRENDRIDPSVGFSDIAALGDEVSEGDLLLRIHAGSVEEARWAEEAVRGAISIGSPGPPPPDTIRARLN